MIEAHGAPEPIPAAFWDSFWSLVDDPVANLDAGEVTVRTAALAGTLPDLQGRVARCAGLYPGVSAAAAAGYPKPFTLEALARCPTGPRPCAWPRPSTTRPARDRGTAGCGR